VGKSGHREIGKSRVIGRLETWQVYLPLFPPVSLHPQICFSIFGDFGNLGIFGNSSASSVPLCFKGLFYSALAANSPVSIFPDLFICTKMR
jgi:hypothetical protein